MARDAGGTEPREREYLYKKCATCRLKVNIFSYYCPRCKNRVDWDANKEEWGEERVYGSRDSGDELYGLMLCSADRCMVCEEALRGNPCRYAFCYGTGRGRCALCERYENRRHRCCRERRREDEAFMAAVSADGWDPPWGKGR